MFGQSGRVLVFPGSGTAGWEAAIGNCLSPRDMVLTSSFGQFSGLWVDMCRRFRLNVKNFDMDWGEGVPLDLYRRRLEADKHHRIKVVLPATMKPQPVSPATRWHPQDP